MNKTNILIGGAALLLLFAGVANAGTSSDYASENDWCSTALDADGVRSDPPTDAAPADNWCEGGLAGSDEDPEMDLAPGPGVGLVTCQSNPNVANGDTQCVGGYLAAADTTFGFGNFGGDYPVVDNVVVNVGAPPARYFMEVCETRIADSAPGAGDAGDITCVTGASTCINAAFTVTSTAGFSIDSITLFRDGITTPTACGNIASATRTGSFDFTYATETPTGVGGNFADANLNSVTAGTPTGSFTWDAEAYTTAGAYGECSIWVIVAGDSDVLGFAQISGPQDNGGNTCGPDSDVSTGVSTCVGGQDVDIVATAWSIGRAYAYAESSGVC